MGRIALSPHEAVAYLHEDAIQKVDVAVGDPVVVEWVNVEVAYDPDILGPGEVSFEGTVLGEMAVSVDSSQEGVLRIQAEGSVLLEGTLPFLDLIFQPVAVGSAIPTFTHFEVNGGEVSTDARAARITVEP